MLGVERLRTAYFKARGFERAKPKRYSWLTKLASEHRCRRILEIGVLHGEHAEQMICAAQENDAGQVEYYGFDLFEPLDAKRLATEASKQPWPIERVQARLTATGAKVRLFAGDTHRTLAATVPKLPTMDLIVIDGGHSLDTIANDWRWCRQLMHSRTSVLFDDHYNRTRVGARRTVAAIDRSEYDVTLLPNVDRFAQGWRILEIQYALVRPRNACAPSISS